MSIRGKGEKGRGTGHLVATTEQFVVTAELRFVLWNFVRIGKFNGTTCPFCVPLKTISIKSAVSQFYIFLVIISKEKQKKVSWKITERKLIDSYVYFEYDSE